MNRQIKFRVWDKLGKHMYYANPHFSIDFLGKVHNLQNGAAGDDFELMQYTGLNDKNGKEIYEGDIVRGVDYCDYKYKIAIIEICTFGGICYCDPKIPNMEDEDIWDKNRCLTFDQCYNEVIGNIFENSNLLK